MESKKKNVILTILIVSFFTIGFICQPFQLLVTHNFPVNDQNSEIRTSSNNPTITSNNIFINDTKVISLFETIKVQINTTQFDDANYTKIQFKFSDGTGFIDDMVHDTTGDEKNFTYTYTPSYNIPTGQHDIFFQIYDNSDELLNANETKTTFMVESNYYAATFVKKELHVGNILDVALTINNISGYNFTYDVSIVDATNESSQQDLLFIGNNIDWFNRTIKRSVFEDLNTYYYIKVNLTAEATGRVRATYFTFKLLNKNPEIIESTIDLPGSVLRSNVNNSFVSLNVSDFESEPENLTVSMSFTDRLGTSIEYALFRDDYNNFSTAFHIGISNPIGYYYVTITATDPYGDSSTYSSTILVMNNAPEIISYTINGYSTSQRISVNYGDDLVFGFNLTDKEGSDNIEYITVSLLGSNNNWINVSKQYSQGVTITISSYELVFGVWYVYLSVSDSDGGSATLGSDYGLAPQQIRVIPDIIRDILPWIGLISGIILGLLIGTGVAYQLLKRRLKAGVISKTEPKKKKKAKKSQEEAPPKEKEEKKEEEEEEEEEDIKPTKRKIKRGF